MGNKSYQSVQLQLRGDQRRGVLRIGGRAGTAAVDVGSNVVDLFTVLVHDLRSKATKGTRAKVSHCSADLSNRRIHSETYNAATRGSRIGTQNDTVLRTKIPARINSVSHPIRPKQSASLLSLVPCLRTDPLQWIFRALVPCRQRPRWSCRSSWP